MTLNVNRGLHSRRVRGSIDQAGGFLFHVVNRLDGAGGGDQVRLFNQGGSIHPGRRRYKTSLPLNQNSG